MDTEARRIGVFKIFFNKDIIRNAVFLSEWEYQNEVIYQT